jgi:hypothetical protein
MYVALCFDFLKLNMKAIGKEIKKREMWIEFEVYNGVNVE